MGLEGRHRLKVVGIHRLLAQFLFQVLGRGLLDKGVFGVWHHSPSHNREMGTA